MIQGKIDVTGIKATKRRVKSIGPKLTSAFGTLVKELRKSIKMKSPVVSYNFYRSWNIKPPNKLTTEIINTAEYAEAIVYGGVPGQPPWPNAGPLTSEIGGRIWSNKTLDNPPNVGTFEQTVLDPDRINARFGKLVEEEFADDK
jgi:hypothetical protein